MIITVANRHHNQPQKVSKISRTIWFVLFLNADTDRSKHRCHRRRRSKPGEIILEAERIIQSDTTFLHFYYLSDCLSVRLRLPMKSAAFGDPVLMSEKCVYRYAWVTTCQSAAVPSGHNFPVLERPETINGKKNHG